MLKCFKYYWSKSDQHKMFIFFVSERKMYYKLFLDKLRTFKPVNRAELCYKLRTTIIFKVHFDPAIKYSQS